MFYCIVSSFLFSLPPILPYLFLAKMWLSRQYQQCQYLLSRLLFSSWSTYFSASLEISIFSAISTCFHACTHAFMIAARPGFDSMHSPGYSMSDTKITEKFLHTSEFTLGHPIPKQAGDRVKMQHCSCGFGSTPTQAETHTAQHTRNWIPRDFL